MTAGSVGEERRASDELSSVKADAGAARDAGETGDGGVGRADGVAVRASAHLAPNHQTPTLVTESITLTKSQMKGRERIGQLKIKHKLP